ncbi:MAG: DUF1616 domain-containing protein [Candidatus Bathyarchaeota archaeon]|nr:DUF1616 domain-containing protein [Candidatus Bathyarchaeota archaeon]
MINLNQSKILILIVTIAVALLVASPAIEQFVVLPQPDSVSELGLLNSQHTAANYPSNITPATNYTVFLYVGNHLGHSAYYMIQVKLFNQTQFNSSTPKPCLFNETFFVEDEQSWELPIVFSLNYTYNQNLTQVNVNQITVNGATANAGPTMLFRDSKREGYFGYLVFELWVYNSATKAFENHGRSVNLVLNMLKEGEIS